MKYEQIKNILVTTGYTQQGYKDQILEYINKLQRENKILKENAENNDKVVDKVNWENQLLKKENKQLKDNWNKLKEFIKSQNDGGIFGNLMIISDVLNKMQELEQGSDSNE